MQQFTRSLTREIEVGGERLALTLSKEGLSVRPVGGRRPPHTMTWEACLCACVASGGSEPSAEQIKQALETIRAGAAKPKEKPDSAEKAAAPSASTHPATDKIAPENSSNSSRHSMKELLARLDQWLSAHRKRFQHALQPGASSADFDALAAALGNPVPEELRTLLAWHNGQNPDVPGAFEGSWNLLSAQEIAETKKDLDAESHEGWNKAWAPFLDDDNGNFLCLEIGSHECPVIECWRGRSDHPKIAPSLSAWLADFVAALERGAYTEDSERGTLVKHS